MVMVPGTAPPDRDAGYLDQDAPYTRHPRLPSPTHEPRLSCPYPERLPGQGDTIIPRCDPDDSSNRPGNLTGPAGSLSASLRGL